MKKIRIRRNNRWLKNPDHQDLKDLEDRKGDIMKKWYASKTLWINVLAMIAIVIQKQFEVDILDEEMQGSLLILINVLLRCITKEPINWR